MTAIEKRQDYNFAGKTANVNNSYQVVNNGRDRNLPYFLLAGTTCTGNAKRNVDGKKGGEADKILVSNWLLL